MPMSNQAPVSGGGNSQNVQAYPGPRVYGHYGDSLTADTGATLPYGYVKLLQDRAGTSNVLQTSVKAGVGGEKMNQIAARLIANLSGLDAAVLWGGTNDALQNYPLERTTQWIRKSARACKLAGIPLFVITPASFYGATFGIPQYTTPAKSIRDWIIANASAVGYIVVDLWPTMVGTDNNLLPGKGSGDGIHLSSEDYAEVVRLLQIAIAAAGYVGTNYVKFAGPANLCSNPTNAGSAGLPTGATITAQSGTATGWTRTLVPDTSGELVSGSSWLVIDANAAAGAGNLQIAFAGASITAANIMAAVAKIHITDGNGTTMSQLRANSGYVDYGISTGGIIQGGQFIGLDPAGEISYRFTAVSTTTHRPHLIINLVAGQRLTVSIGDIGLFDLTASGLT